MATAAVLPRTRRRVPTAGPESELVAAALRDRATLLSRQQVFEEPALPTGFPDVVIVDLWKQRRRAPSNGPRLTGLHLRLLQHLSTASPSTVPDLAADLLWKRAEVDAAVRDLGLAGLATVRDGTIESRPLPEIFVVRRIIAIEAKLRDWRHAIEQACANTWFASHSFVLLPRQRFNDRVQDAAIDAGVGVLCFDGTSVTIPVKASEHAIPSSYGSWLFNEWALNRMRSSVDNA
jgi:hypothetical protein